jgi:hypothetical protein
MNAARLAVTATFARGMPNYRVTPRTRPWPGDVAVYHAMPHGLRDPMGREVSAQLWVNTESVQDGKRTALAAHASQRDWLDSSQGMDSYLQTMEDFAREAGRRSGRFTFAEGWNRRLHLGFGPEGWDPLREALGGLCAP